MAKQNLYEFLGVTPDASEADIRRACEALRGVIRHEPDAQQRQNRSIFLRHAESILTDSGKRAEYDARLGGEAALGPMPHEYHARTRRWHALVLLGLLMACGAWAWRHPGAQPAEPNTAPATTKKVSGNDDNQNHAADSFSLAFPAPDAQSDAASALQAGPGTDDAPAKATPQYQVQIDGPNGKLLGQLTWSVFAIAGSSGFGTGVLIDDEKLLTNCHIIAHNAGYNRKLYAINSVTRQRVEVTRVAFMAYKGEDACLAIAPGLQGRPVQLGNIYALQTGATLHNIGFALGKLTASDGQFLRMAEIGGQGFIESSNFCDHGVSGGPLVDDSGALVGLTTGGPADRSVCYSVTVETAKRVLYEPTIRAQDFPTNYVSNVVR